MNAALQDDRLPSTPATPIAEYSQTAAALSHLRNKYGSIAYDVRTKAGMADAKLARAELRGYRVSLEKTRVEIKAPALERCRLIDTEAKRITAELVALEGPIDETIKGEEDRIQREKEEAERLELERVAEVNRRFEALKALPNRIFETVDQVNAAISEAGAFDPTTFEADMQAAAVFEKKNTLMKLRAALDKAEREEADRQELAALRAQQAEVEAERERLAKAERDRIAEAERLEQQRIQAERDERIRQEAQEAAQRTADEAAATARQQLQEAEERQQAQAEQAERERIAAAEAAEAQRLRDVAAAEQRVRDEAAEADRLQRLEDERRAADRAHRGRVNRKALAALVQNNVDETEGKRIIELIATGKIPAISIAY